MPLIRVEGNANVGASAAVPVAWILKSSAGRFDAPVQKTKGTRTSKRANFMKEPKPPRGGIATVAPTRSNRTMLRISPLLLLLALFLSACAAPRDGAEDTWARRTSDFIDPLVPDSLRFGPKEPALKASVKVDPPDFALADRREVRVIFTVKNTTKKAERLEFPTAQRIELSLRSPDGKRIFLWSEDRLFEPMPAIVVINPGERIEYEAVVPTRDMIAGAVHAADVGLVGRPDVATSVSITPR